MEASARASLERGQAESLRAEESRLRATLRDSLPPSTQVAELRRLAEDLRVAEASLGGGTSITIRPRRELTVTASVDGASAASRTVDAALLPDFSAKWTAHISAIALGGTFHLDNVDLVLDRDKLVNQLERGGPS